MANIQGIPSGLLDPFSVLIQKELPVAFILSPPPLCQGKGEGGQQAHVHRGERPVHAPHGEGRPGDRREQQEEHHLREDKAVRRLLREAAAP